MLYNAALIFLVVRILREKLWSFLVSFYWLDKLSIESLIINAKNALCKINDLLSWGLGKGCNL